MFYLPDSAFVRVFGQHAYGSSHEGSQKTTIQAFERVLDDTGDVTDSTPRYLYLDPHGSRKSNYQWYYQSSGLASDHAAQGSSKSVSDILVPIFRAGALVLSIPSIIVSTPSLRFPHILYRYYVNPSRLFTIFCVVSLSLVPPSITCTLRDVTLLLACSGTFLLPGTSLLFESWLSLSAVPLGCTRFISINTHHYSLLPPPSCDHHTPGFTFSAWHATLERGGVILTSIPRPALAAQGTGSPAQAIGKASNVGHWNMAATYSRMCIHPGVDRWPHCSEMVACIFCTSCWVRLCT